MIAPLSFYAESVGRRQLFVLSPGASSVNRMKGVTSLCSDRWRKQTFDKHHSDFASITTKRGILEICGA